MYQSWDEVSKYLISLVLLVCISMCSICLILPYLRLMCLYLFLSSHFFYEYCVYRSLSPTFSFSQSPPHHRQITRSGERLSLAYNLYYRSSTLPIPSRHHKQTGSSLFTSLLKQPYPPSCCDIAVKAYLHRRYTTGAGGSSTREKTPSHSRSRPITPRHQHLLSLEPVAAITCRRQARNAFELTISVSHRYHHRHHW